MKFTLANGVEIAGAPLSFPLAGELGYIAEFEGALYIVEDERFEGARFVRGNRHKLKLRGVRAWVGAHRVRAVGRVV